MLFRSVEDDPGAWAAPVTAWQPSGDYHRVVLVRRLGARRWVRTWGQDIEVSADRWERAVVALDAVWSRDLLDAMGTTPAGMDFAALSADMDAMA